MHRSVTPFSSKAVAFFKHFQNRGLPATMYRDPLNPRIWIITVIK